MDHMLVRGLIGALLALTLGASPAGSPSSSPAPQNAEVVAGVTYLDALAAGPLCGYASERSFGAASAGVPITIAPPCLPLSDPMTTWVLANKRTPLQPLSYAAPDLRLVRLPGGYRVRDAAATALEALSAAAHAAGVGTLGLTSGNRSYASQVSIYAGHVQDMGQGAADLASARPGFSEHQTGWAADVDACDPGCTGADAFGVSRTGKWVTANAWRFGFIVRYEPGQTAITGYESEPWHLRYLGVAMSTDYHANGFHTYEQFLGAPPAPTY
jgi:D-alanyl-D-alanine carboxypeptidase